MWDKWQVCRYHRHRLWFTLGISVFIITFRAISMVSLNFHMKFHLLFLLSYYWKRNMLLDSIKYVTIKNFWSVFFFQMYEPNIWLFFFIEKVTKIICRNLSDKVKVCYYNNRQLQHRNTWTTRITRYRCDRWKRHVGLKTKMMSLFIQFEWL